MQPSFFRYFLNIFNTPWGSRLGLMRPETVWLVPLRVFIASGWLRACAEKIFDPQWSRGETLKMFLEIQQSAVAFPFYGFLIQHLFMPYAKELAFIVLLGQWLVGLGILFGACTRVALLAGIFMNFNFLFIGRPDPNAFYILIQWVLLLARSDKVLSVDALLNSQKESQKSYTVYRWMTFIFIGLMVMMIPFIKAFTPAQSVKDSAAVLMVLFGVMGLSTFLIALQQKMIRHKHIRQGTFDTYKDSRLSEFTREATRF